MLGETDSHPISLKTPTTQCQLIDRKERKEKKVETRLSHPIEYKARNIVRQGHWEGNKGPAVQAGSAARLRLHIPMCHHTTACKAGFTLRAMTWARATHGIKGALAMPWHCVPPPTRLVWSLIWQPPGVLSEWELCWCIVNLSTAHQSPWGCHRVSMSVVEWKREDIRHTALKQPTTLKRNTLADHPQLSQHTWSNNAARSAAAVTINPHKLLM